MVLCYRESHVSIALTVLFVYALYLVLLRRGKKIKAEV